MVEVGYEGFFGLSSYISSPRQTWLFMTSEALIIPLQVLTHSISTLTTVFPLHAYCCSPVNLDNQHYRPTIRRHPPQNSRHYLLSPILHPNPRCNPQDACVGSQSPTISLNTCCFTSRHVPMFTCHCVLPWDTIAFSSCTSC